MIDALISPLLPGLILCALLVLGWRWLPRWVLDVVAVLASLCLLLVTPLGANALVRAVESHADNEMCVAPLPSTIVVLAGGADEHAAQGDYAALNQASTRRLIGGVRAWRRQPQATLVISGGTDIGGTLESPLMAALARELDVPATALQVESRARTTWESAQFLRHAQPALPRRVQLVTSALHMPRAMYAMRAAGFDPCANPVDYRYHEWTGLGYLLPSGGAIGKSEAALHELVGLLAYHFRAWFEN